MFANPFINLKKLKLIKKYLISNKKYLYTLFQLVEYNYVNIGKF